MRSVNGYTGKSIEKMTVPVADVARPRVGRGRGLRRRHRSTEPAGQAATRYTAASVSRDRAVQPAVRIQLVTTSR